MSEVVPAIYAPPLRPIRLSLYGRVLALAIAAAASVLIITAWRLKPSPDGLGTHTEMGFYGCSLLTTTGVPCPSCGMTTSFSWFYRGNVLASCYVQPMGCLLAFGVFATLLGAVYEALTGRPAHRLLRVLPVRRWLLAGVTVLAFAWAWKIMIHLSGRDGW